MDITVVKQFLNFFQEFIHLCHKENWPDDNTSVDEIKKAFLISQHVEKCLEMLRNRSLDNDFISTLSNCEDCSIFSIQNCLCNPPRYVLKKVIHSPTKISQMDEAFKIFVEIFSEDSLEICLSDIMLESASKRTLLENLSTELPRNKILEFKCTFLLSELHLCKDQQKYILDMFSNFKVDTIELLTVCLLNKESKYEKEISNIVQSFVKIMSNREHTNKVFWKHLFRIDEKYLIDMCAQYTILFSCISKALVDCGRLLHENMSLEYFYIDLTYSELVSVLQCLCKDENLKIEFCNTVQSELSTAEFWNNIMSCV